MKFMGALLFLAAGAGAAAPESTNWATVPASRDGTRLETVAIPSEPDDGMVSLVGQPVEKAARALRPVVSMELDPVRNLKADPGDVSGDDNQRRPPPDSIWPGPDGKMSAPSEVQTFEVDGLRNPWEVRDRPRRELAATSFTNGGVIGAGADAVALLNGHIAKKGCVVEGYEVSQVTPSYVVIRKSGVPFVVPKGRRVEIQSPQR